MRAKPGISAAIRHNPAFRIAATIVRRQFTNPALAADSFTACQMTFSVMPSPQIVPLRLMHRNSGPVVISAAVVQPSIAAFTQPGTGTVRMWAALPIRSAMTQCSSLCCRELQWPVG